VTTACSDSNSATAGLIWHYDAVQRANAGSENRKKCSVFSAKCDREWRGDENRANTLVFIGKNLDRAALTEGFKACLA